MAKVKFSLVVSQICERRDNQGDPGLKLWILLQYFFTENGIRSQVLGMGIGKDILWLIPRILYIFTQMWSLKPLIYPGPCIGSVLLADLCMSFR